MTDTRKNNVLYNVGSDDQKKDLKKYVGLVRLLLRQLELDSWLDTSYRLMPQGNVCLTILYTSVFKGCVCGCACVA